MRPIEYRYERAAARSGPSTIARLRRRVSVAVDRQRRSARGDLRRDAVRLRRARSRSHSARRQRSRRTCCGSTWRPGQVHVRAPDQALLVGRDHHPLREHVVGVGQLRAVDALARGRGTRRSTRSSGCSSPAGRRRSACADRSGSRRRRCRYSSSALLADHPDEAEVPVHLPLLAVHDRAQQRPGAPLGAALGARVDPRRAPQAPAARLPAAASAHGAASRREVRGERQRDERQRPRRRASTPVTRRGRSAAGGAREEDDPLGALAGSRRSPAP